MKCTFCRDIRDERLTPDLDLDLGLASGADPGATGAGAKLIVGGR